MWCSWMLSDVGCNVWCGVIRFHIMLWCVVRFVTNDVLEWCAMSWVVCFHFMRFVMWLNLMWYLVSGVVCGVMCLSVVFWDIWRDVWCDWIWWDVMWCGWMLWFILWYATRYVTLGVMLCHFFIFVFFVRHFFYFHFFYTSFSFFIFHFSFLLLNFCFLFDFHMIFLQMDKSLSEIQQKNKINDVKLDQIWKILLKYCEWNSLMGTSIQPDPKANSKPEVRKIIISIFIYVLLILFLFLFLFLFLILFLFLLSFLFSFYFLILLLSIFFVISLFYHFFCFVLPRFVFLYFLILLFCFDLSWKHFL